MNSELELRTEAADLENQLEKMEQDADAKFDAFRTEQEKQVNELKVELKEALMETSDFRMRLEDQAEELEKELKYGKETKKQLDTITKSATKTETELRNLNNKFVKTDEKC